eukprot:1082989-Pyramimonas_sp.AAC.1
MCIRDRLEVPRARQEVVVRSEDEGGDRGGSHQGRGSEGGAPQQVPHEGRASGGDGRAGRTLSLIHI